MTQKHTFTVETAQQFQHTSIPHSVLLAQVAAERGCSCAAYVDWFTYRRWKAQGCQVQRGEKGTRLTVYPEVEEADKNGHTKTRKIPRASHVFCRCQVKEA